MLEDAIFKIKFDAVSQRQSIVFQLPQYKRMIECDLDSQGSANVLPWRRAYDATAAFPTPGQKVGSSNLSVHIFFSRTFQDSVSHYTAWDGVGKIVDCILRFSSSRARASTVGVLFPILCRLSG